MVFEVKGRLKAVVLPRYGSADVLEYKDVEKPRPTEGRMLVKVHASSVNPFDLHSMTGGLARFVGNGLMKPKDSRFGNDFSGVVEVVGGGVTRFKPGDEVYGTAPGAFAEYASVKESLAALKPTNLMFEQAAAVPVAGVTALQTLRDSGHIQAGQKVLINGASGGVGTFALQIAKSYGTEVTAVCSTDKLDQARALGADHVIDYTKEDFTRNGEQYDLICDVACTRLAGAYRRSLKPGGICSIVGFVPMWRLPLIFATGPIASRGGKKIGFMGIAKVTPENLTFLAGLLEARKIVSVVERSYPLAQTAEAIRYLQEGHAKGKVVITIN